MLPFINDGMKNEVDKVSFLWKFSSGGTQNILYMWYYSCSKDPLWAPIRYFFYLGKFIQQFRKNAGSDFCMKKG